MMLRCPREYYYAFVCRRKARGDNTEVLGGKYFHELVANARKAAQLAPLPPDPVQPPPGLDDDHRALLDLMFEGWLARWEVCGREFPNVDFTNLTDAFPHELMGEYDAQIGVHGQVFELKTTKSDISPMGGYWDRLELDIQVSMYYLTSGRPVIYDVVRIPHERPLKATPLDKRRVVTQGERKGELYKGQRAEDESQADWLARVQSMVEADPDSYYQRREVYRTPEEVAEFRKNVLVTAKAFDMYAASDYYPMASQRSICNRFGGACPYLPVCTSRADIADPSLYCESDYNRLV